MNTQNLERKSMSQAVLIFSFMGLLGLYISSISNSVAILIDGVFSIISAVCTLVAIKVAALSDKEDKNYPFGFFGYELLYVILRGTLLLVTVLLALLDSLSKISTYVMTGTVPAVDGVIFIVYVIFIACMYALLNRHYSKYIKLLDGKSELLAAEKFNARANSFLMIGIGVSFILIGVLKFTPLKFLVPISDSIIVFVIACFVIYDTLVLLVRTLKTIGGQCSISSEDQNLIARINELSNAFAEHTHVKIRKVGKTAFVVITLKLKDNQVKFKDIQSQIALLKESTGEIYSVHHTYVDII